MGYTYLASSFIEKLQGIFMTVFESIFAPILTDILELFINYIFELFWTYFSELLLTVLVMFCSLLDVVAKIFDVFAGVSKVTFQNKETYLLDMFFEMKEVSLAFSVITVMAVVICFIFTIIKTAQSIGDMTLENKNPISKVLADGMKAAVTFMLIPFLCIAMLQLSSIVTNQAIDAFDAAQGGETTIGTVVFLASSLEADKSMPKKNPLKMGMANNGYGNKNASNASFTDSLRVGYLWGTKDYKDLDLVKKEFHPTNFNYLVGFVSGILIFYVMVTSVMIFIRRIFELLLLYIVSPLFVSTIPLDDGTMFAKWREAFIAKFFSGFGTIFAMRYYMLMVQTIASSNLVLYNTSMPSGAMINAIMKMLMIIGGAWAVNKAQHLMMQIFNPQMASADQEAANLMKGIVIGAASTAAGVATGGASTAATAASMAGQAASAMGNAASSAGSDNQAYRG